MTDAYNVWKDMFTKSQKMMNDWIEAFPKYGEAKAKEDETFSFNSMGDWMSYQQEWYKNLQEMYKKMNPQTASFSSPYQTWLGMMNQYNPMDLDKFMAPFTREVFEKMQNSQKLYLACYEQWQRFNNEVIKPGTSDYKKNLDSLIEQFNKMFMDNLIPLLPKEFQSLMFDSQSYINTYFKSLENFIGPWAYAYQNIADIAIEGIFEDPMKLSDTLKQWKSAYDQTFGVLVKSPVVGSSREILEQNNKAIDAMIEMLVSISEFITMTSSVGYKHSKEVFSEYAESIENGEKPKTFKEFYDMWSKHVEDAIEEYFYTDEFSKLIAKTSDSAMVFKIEYDKVIEKALAGLPIVTISDVDSVYEKVYELRREIRELQKELEELKAQQANSKQENK